MVNVKSGKDWIPKWKAKVVMATVTKAKTLKSNKARILYIAGGKPCDAEMVRNLHLRGQSKTEMAREALSGEAAFCGVLRSCFWDRRSISV